MLAVRRILHPTDFSDQSHAAFEVACSLARDYGAELVVCHVSPWPALPVAEGVMLDVPGDTTEADRARLEEVKPDDPTVAITRHVRRGEPAAEIVKLAAEEKAHLIVMGTHGRGGLSRLVVGSVAEAVMRKAPCPVLTVRTPFHAAEAATPTAAGAVWGE